MAPCPEFYGKHNTVNMIRVSVFVFACRLYLFPNAVASHELLGYPHGIAVEQLAQERSQRCSVRERQ